MKPRILDINSPEHQNTFALLNTLCERITQDAWLTPKAKSDALKILNNLKYIKLNQAYIKYCVKNIDDPSIYKYSEDKSKGVLRDQGNTSFHINFDNPEDELHKMVRSVEEVIPKLMRCTQPLFYFVTNAFEYDSPTGCNAARISPFLKAATALDTGLSGFDLANIFATHYVKTIQDRNVTVNQAVNDFASAYQLTDDNKAELIAGLKISGVDDEDLHRPLFDAYGDAPAQNIAPQGLDDHLNNSFAIVLGQAGFVQIWFAEGNHDNAHRFVDFLHHQRHLRDIERAKVGTSHNQIGVSVVRLSPAQAQGLNHSRLNEVLLSQPGTSRSHAQQHVDAQRPRQSNCSIS